MDMEPDSITGNSEPQLRSDALLVFWNWKAAALSAAGRAPIFLVATLSHGWHAAAEAALLEAAYRAGTSGLFAAATEGLLRVRPRWLALTAVLAAIPSASLFFDYLIHRSMGTPNLGIGMAISFAASAITSLFNWHSMSRGTLLIGRGRRTLREDLKALPRLIVEFVSRPPLWVWHGTRRLLWDLSEP